MLFARQGKKFDYDLKQVPNCLQYCTTFYLFIYFFKGEQFCLKHFFVWVGGFGEVIKLLSCVLYCLFMAELVSSTTFLPTIIAA